MKAGQNVKRKKSRLSGLNLISVIFFILAAAFYFAHEKKPFLRAQQADKVVQVSTVHDGDTVSIVVERRQEKVRLIGIDAPEIGQKPWGEEAKRSLESIVERSSRKVSIEYDVEKTDQYGRTLAYLRTVDGILINLLMLERGLAVLYTVPPNVKYVEQFRYAQAQARERGAGMWGENGLKEKPRDYRKENPRL